MRALAASALWGYAEATTFFIVPDVLIGWIALRSIRLATASAIAASAGAVVGGVAVYRDAERMRAGSLAIPGISEPMIRDAEAAFAHDRWRAVIRAPLDGIPYKIYAAEARFAGRPLVELVLVTPFARAWRFLLTAVGACVAGAILSPVRRRLGLWLLAYGGAWAVSYAAYFRTLERRYGHARGA